MDRRILALMQMFFLLILAGVFATASTGGHAALAAIPAQPAGVPVNSAPASPASAAGTAFTYQGRLTVSNSLANGQFDLKFTLFDAATAGNQVGSPVTVISQTVTDGLFTVQLDYGPVFQGSARWLELGVRPGGSGGSFTTLAPRQALTAAPYAAGLLPGATITGTNGSNLLTLTNLGSGSTGLYASADAYGVQGVATSVAGTGGYFLAINGGAGTGVYGGGTLTGVYGSGTNGVYGVSGAGFGSGVYGVNNNAGTAGYFESSTDPNNGIGVYGTSHTGVWGDGSAGNGFGVIGVGDTGVIGSASTSTGTGVSGTGATGVSGDSDNGFGVYASTNQTDGSALFAQANNGFYTKGVEGSTDQGFAVYGQGNADGAWGVTGISNQTGNARGVYGESNLNTGVGVYGSSTNGLAGKFDGGVQVNGTMTVTGFIFKAGGGFVIDDPTDPANKYLYHSFVESPDMLDLYRGHVTLDAQGEATVTMPEWFQAVNEDFDYQLTAVGAPGPNLYIAQEIQGNRFKIAGGKPGMKVSWQVTGTRHDPYADANRIPVVENKASADKGKYLHPELYGQDATQGIGYSPNKAQTDPHVAAPQVGPTRPVLPSPPAAPPAPGRPQGPSGNK